MGAELIRSADVANVRLSWSTCLKAEHVFTKFLLSRRPLRFAVAEAILSLTCQLLSYCQQMKKGSYVTEALRIHVLNFATTVNLINLHVMRAAF